MHTKKTIREKLLASVLTLAMVFGMMPAMTMEVEAADVSVGTWDDLQTAMATDGNNITLTQTITADADDTVLVVPANTTVTLDLAGRTIDRNLDIAKENGNVIDVEGTLTINDSSSPSTGKITGGNSSTMWYEAGAITIKNDGIVTLNGGSITENIITYTHGYGAGVSVHKGYFTMNGGSITNNQSTTRGGGVAVNGGDDDDDGIVDGYAKLLGGNIEYNKVINTTAAYAYGGGVSAAKSNLEVGGDIIIDNNTGKHTGISDPIENNVYLSSNTFFMILNTTTPLTDSANIGITLPPYVNMAAGYKFIESDNGSDVSNYVKNFTPDDSASNLFVGMMDDSVNSLYLANDTYFVKPVVPSITYVLNNGEDSSKVVIADDMTIPTPTKADHTFDGWYDNDTFTGDALTETDIKALDTDTTLYAKWMNGDKTVVTAPIVITNDTETVDNADEGWAWDKDTKTLTLDGFTQVLADEDGIDFNGFTGDVTIVLEENSENSIKTNYNCVDRSDFNSTGTVTIKGSGKLTLESQNNPTVLMRHRSLIIEDATINVPVSNGAISGKALTIKNATVDVASSMSNTLSVSEGELSIINSTVDVKNTDSGDDPSAAIYTRDGSIRFKDSTITASATGNVIQAPDSTITIDGGTVTATAGAGKKAFEANNATPQITFVKTPLITAGADANTAEVVSAYTGQAYAKIEVPPAPPTYTVTFDPNGGQFADGSTDTKTVSGVTSGTKIDDVIGKPANPTKDGYVLTQWRGEGYSFVEGITKDIDFEAIWALQTPKNVRTSKTTDSVTLTWDPVPNAAKYKVAVLTEDYTQISRETITETTYTATGLTENTTYLIEIIGYTADELLASADFSVEVTPSAPTPPSSGGGSSSGGSSSNEPDVDVDKDTGNVSAKPDVSTQTNNDGTTTAKPNQSSLEKAINEASEEKKDLKSDGENSTADVVIEVNTNSKTKAVGMELIVENVDDMVEKDIDNLVITSDIGTVTLDRKALEAIADGKESGETVILIIREVEDATAELTDEQKAIVGDEQVYELYIEVNGNRVSDFNGGTATVEVPDGLTDDVSEIKVYYVDDEGNIEYKPTTYDKENGTITFVTDHFSHYLISTKTLDITLPFVDVNENDWFYDSVQFAYQNGLMNGTSDTTFEPNFGTTRAMMAEVIWNMEGKPTINSASVYSDVSNNEWYSDAIAWTSENGIYKGFGDGTFRPNDNITREQLVAILYRYADYKGMDIRSGENTNILSYDDAFDISEYAIPAMQWAIYEDIISGKTENTLDPKGTATRVEIATMIHRFMEMEK